MRWRRPTPYLRMFSLVTAGWLMARQALAARRRARGQRAPTPSCSTAKIGTARFFCEQLLPAVHGLVPAATASADALFALDRGRASAAEVTLLDGLALFASIPSPELEPDRPVARVRAHDRSRACSRRSSSPVDGGRRPVVTRTTCGPIAVWAVPAGLIGARLYHVATDWKTYFSAGGRPIEALYIWQGGLGIPGGIAPRCRGRGVRGLPQGHAPTARSRCGGARPSACAGDRPVGQLLQPRGVRPADHAAVGPRDRSGPSPARVHQRDHLPSDVPVRGALEPRPHGPVDLDRSQARAATRQPLRAVRRRATDWVGCGSKPFAPTTPA